MPGMSTGFNLWSSKHRSSRSKGSISSLSRTPTSPTAAGFGIPSPDDPDPFGVRALELAGLAIKEAGSRSRPTSDAFDFKPSPSSPVFRLSTQSIDGTVLRESRRHSRRDSKRSVVSIDHATQTSSLPSPPPLEEEKELCNSPPPIEEESEGEAEHGIEDVPEPQDELTRDSSQESFETSEQGADDELEVLANDHEATFEIAMPSVQILTRARATPVASKPKVVNIIKRAPPPSLPARNPLRQRRVRAIEPVVESDLADEDLKDDSSSTYSSPAKSSFDRDDSPNPWSAQTSIQDNESLKHKDDNNTDQVPDIDIPPLSDGDDGSSLAESDATHHENSHHTQTDSRLAPYSMGEYGNTSGETLALSVAAGESLDVHEHKRKSFDGAANESQQSITHLVTAAPAHSSTNVSDADVTSDTSSVYEDRSPSPAKEERFHSTSSIPLDLGVSYEKESASIQHDTTTQDPTAPVTS